MSKLLNLEVANITSQTLTTNALVNLGNITRKYCVKCNCKPTFSYENGGTSISLNQAGYYVVRINSTFSGVPGVVTLQLNANGIAVPQAQVSETITTANTEVRSMSFSTIVKVLPCSTVPLTVTNTGVSSTISNFAIDIIKII